MSNPQKRKGDKAELECASLISDLLGFRVKRALGAGRKEDTGDIFGVPDHAIQVAAWADVAQAVRQKPLEAEQQRIHAEATFAATFVKFPRAGFRVILTPEQWAMYVRESLS